MTRLGGFALLLKLCIILFLIVIDPVCFNIPSWAFNISLKFYLLAMIDNLCFCKCEKPCVSCYITKPQHSFSPMLEILRNAYSCFYSTFCSQTMQAAFIRYNDNNHHLLHRSTVPNPFLLALANGEKVVVRSTLVGRSVDSTGSWRRKKFSFCKHTRKMNPCS